MVRCQPGTALQALQREALARPGVFIRRSAVLSVLPIHLVGLLCLGVSTNTVSTY